MSIIAIQKLQAEMAKDTDDDMLQDVGSYLIAHINKNPNDADKIAAADKTIMKSIEEMAAVAKSKQKNGRAGLSAAVGFAIVLNYFGIDGQNQETAPDASKKIKLDDLF